MMSKDEKSLDELEKAVEIRKEISRLYEEYRVVKDAALKSAHIPHHDFKRAVDAIHYLGGGWPSENSKGRMEAAIDNVAGMYKVLHFAGLGNMVEDHFAQNGILIQLCDSIKDVDLGEDEMKFLEREFNLTRMVGEKPKFKKLSELIRFLLDEGNRLQTLICNLADEIKFNLKPLVKEKFGVENEEYDRLFDLARFTADGKDDKALKKKAAVNTSISSFIKTASRLKKK